jgi:glycosyltransferase involved in cell wall biosynthesis
VKRYSGDHRLTMATASYMTWFYSRLDRVFSRSRHYQASLRELGVADDRLRLASPGFDPAVFSPEHRDINLWSRLGVREPRRLLYCGRVSLEKNLGLLAESFAALCRQRNDTALIIAGDGPYLPDLRKLLDGLPAYFLGYQDDSQLGPIYASSDLFVFPSRTDTMGQVVIEAQASGLPVLVSDEGGPREVMDHDVTGLVLPGEQSAAWTDAMHLLLDDEPRRQRMARTAPPRMGRYSVSKSFEAFWDDHWQAVQEMSGQPDAGADKSAASAPHQTSRVSA